MKAHIANYFIMPNGNNMLVGRFEMTAHGLEHLDTGMLFKPVSERRGGTAAHLAHIEQAIRDGRLEGLCFWAAPRRPFIRIGRSLVIVGDDFGQSGGSHGPQAFDEGYLHDLISTSDFITILSGAAIPEVYAASADLAIAGEPATIIETQPEHEVAWFDYVRAVAPSADLLVASPNCETGPIRNASGADVFKAGADD